MYVYVYITQVTQYVQSRDAEPSLVVSSKFNVES